MQITLRASRKFAEKTMVGVLDRDRFGTWWGFSLLWELSGKQTNKNHSSVCSAERKEGACESKTSKFKSKGKRKDTFLPCIDMFIGLFLNSAAISLCLSCMCLLVQS